MDLCGSGVHCKCAFCVMQTDPLHTLDDLEDFQEDMRNAALMRATVGAVAMRKIVLVLVCLLSVICFAVVVWTGHGVGCRPNPVAQQPPNGMRDFEVSC